MRKIHFGWVVKCAKTYLGVAPLHFSALIIAKEIGVKSNNNMLSKA